MNLFSLLDQTASRLPSHGAVYHGDVRVQTFVDLRNRALLMSAGFSSLCKRAARVAVLAENLPQYIEILFGIWAAGLVAVPINAKLHYREVIQVLNDCEASVLLVSPRLSGDWGPHTTVSAAAACRIIVIGSEEYEGLFEGAPVSPADVEPDSTAWLFYTSGTTGRSKGAMLSHRNLLAMSIAHLADMEVIDDTASLVHAAPMSHGSGLYILAYVLRGGRQVVPLSGGFSPVEFIDLCGCHPSCGAFFAPTMVQRLRLEVERSGRRPLNLRSIVYGGGPMYVEELKKSMAALGPVFCQIYGQGESPMTITGLRHADHTAEDERILGSVGYARSGVEVRVVGPDGLPLPSGQVGEITCRGDVVMTGYWRNPDGTTEALRCGWLHTGDLGEMDERGYLTLRDRMKDVVISGGANIYPREVEEILLQHPSVSEACVVGEPDPGWGETVVAFIVFAEGVDPNADQLNAHCLERIARYKRPRRYIFVDSLPKNNYGKILKRELKNELLRRRTS